MNQQYVSSKDLSDLLGLKPKTVTNWRRRKTGPPFHRISPSCVRYSLPEVEHWMASRKVEPGKRTKRWWL